MGRLSLSDSLILALVRFGCRAVYPRQTIRFRQRLGYWPDPATPATVPEKFFWRKIFDRNPMLVIACDKLASKDMAQSICPELKVPETLWSGTDPERIPPALLRGNVVVKANHGCRWNIMVKDGKVDLARLHRKMRRWVSSTFGRHLAEWAYTGVRRRVLVEAMLMEDGEAIAREYKFHVAGGRTAYVFVSLGRFSAERQKYTLNRDGMAYSLDEQASFEVEAREPPRNFLRMRDIAERLGKHFDYVRCDLYEHGDDIYFSELTVYPSSGLVSMKSAELMEVQNRSWDLRLSWFLRSRQSGWRHLYALALTRWLEQWYAGQAAGAQEAVRGERQATASGDA